MICFNLVLCMHFNSFFIYFIINFRPLTELYKVELRKYKEVKKKY